MTHVRLPRSRLLRSRGLRACRGAVLIEALLGALLAAVVLAAALDIIVRATRASGEQAVRASARAQLEQAATVLATDLRAVATAASGSDPTDLRVVSDTAVEFDATIGGGIACATAVSGSSSTIDLASVPDLSATPTLAWWAAPPRAGDVAVVYDNAGTPSATDDRWTVRTVRVVSEGTTYCRSGPFAAAAASSARADASRLRLTLDAPQLPAAIGAGTPVRIVRRRRYALYRSTEGWQLGVRDWDGSAWETVQPIAGPFAAPADRGLLLEAVDASGAAVQGNPPSGTAVEFRVLLRAPCPASTSRVRCIDSTLAVVRPRGNG